MEKQGTASARICITLTKTDYAEQVDKELRQLRKTARMPGFRPGQAPLGILRRLYGGQLTTEVVNRLLGERLVSFIREQKIEVMGEPLPSLDKLPPADWQEQESVDFVFEVALVPELNVSLGAEDKIPLYNVDVTDEMVDRQVEAYRSRQGEMKDVEVYSEKDMLRGILTELDEAGEPKEGGVRVEGVSMLPTYMKSDEEKAKFEGAKKGDSLRLNLSAAYGGNETELASILRLSKDEAKEKTGDFLYEIASIGHFEAAPLGQELYDAVYGKGQVASEEEFRERIRKELAGNMERGCRQRFAVDLRKHLLERIGKPEYADELLGRIMRLNSKEGEGAAEQTPEEMERMKEALTWHYAQERLASQLGLEMREEDLKETAKEMARMQFESYGMSGLGDDIITAYAERAIKDKGQAEVLADRTLDRLIVDKALTLVTLERKTVTVEELNKLD